MLRLVAAVAVLVLGLSGCGSNGGSGSPATSSGSGGSGDAEAWAEKVCKSVEGEVATLTKDPNIDTSSPEAAKAGLTAFLTDFGTALDRLIGGIKAAGDPPVADGKELVAKTTQGLEQAKQNVQDARAKLEQTPMTDPAAAKQAFTEVAEKMTSIGNLDTTKEMEDNPQLKEAFETAPTCKRLDSQQTGGGSSTPTST